MQSIKNWAEDDRPREKMILKGEHSLSNAELLAIIIGSGTRHFSALAIAQQMLNDAENNFKTLQSMGRLQLMHYPGVGDAKSTVVAAVLEIARRSNNETDKKDKKIGSSRDAYNYLKQYLVGLNHEEFYVLFLNRANVVLSCEQISKGGLSGTVADGKVIFSQALKHKASGLILAHNHPSGQLKPSEADKRLTKSLVEFGKLIEIQILDHLILTNNNYLSFADEGLMSF